MKVRRRSFLLWVIGALGLPALGWLGWRRWYRDGAKGDDDEGDALAALADAIVPADEFPGAVQAGVPGMLRRALAQSASKQDQYSRGLAGLDALSLAVHRVRFSRLNLDARSALLERLAWAGSTEPERRARAFFEFARRDVMRAYYSTPEARTMLGYRPPREGGYPDD